MSHPLSTKVDDKIKELKKGIEEKVQQGAKFIFDCMKDGKVPSYRPKDEQYGLWTPAEMACFLLTNHILPKTCSQKIEQIIDFLISNFDRNIGAWPATINGTQEYFSAHMTGYCTYVLKLYSNEFLEDDRKDDIQEIIEKAEQYILCKQQAEGFWTPDSRATKSPDGINYPDFFYSYYSYFGIRDVKGYHRKANTDMNNALQRTKNYFRKYAENLIASFNPQSVTSVTLTDASKLLQVLSDFDDNSLTELLEKLHSITLLIFESVKRNFATTSVTLDRLDSNTQRTFTNNTPFDVYFALRSDKSSSTQLLQVVEWYLGKQDVANHCWYLDADSKTNVCTWTTIEALLVLSDAYDFLAEDFYLREQQLLDERQRELNSYRDKAESEKNAQLEQLELDKQRLNSRIQIINKRNNIRMGLSIGVSIVISIICFVIFLVVVTKEMTPTLETIIIVVILGLGVNAIFQGVLFIMGLVQKKIKELDNLLKDSDDKDSKR